MAGLGEALGVVALVVAIKGTFDTYVFLDDLFRQDEDARSLLLDYKTINVRLEWLLVKLDRMIEGGNNPLASLDAKVKNLIVGHLTEITIWNENLGTVLEAEGIQELPSFEKPLGVKSFSDYVTPEDDKKKWVAVVPKRPKRFKLRKKELFKKNLEKLSMSVGALELMFGTTVLADEQANAIVALLMSKLEKAELVIMGRPEASHGALAASVARLVLADGDPANAPNAPWISPGKIEIEDEGNGKRHLRSMGNYDGQRVLIEWKPISGDLSGAQRDEVNRRVETLGGLLFQSKAADFRVPVCLGLYNKSLLEKGYVFKLPSSNSNRMGFYSLGSRMLPRKSTSRSGKTREKPATIPLLGHRFELAYQLSKAFSSLLAAKWLHKDFCSDNVLFFDKVGLRTETNTIDVSEMYIAGFQYSRPGKDETIERAPESVDIRNTIYRHPELTNLSQGLAGLKAPRYHPLYDLYSLGVVLLEIALWRPLSTEAGVSKHGADGEEREKWLLQAADVLGSQVGATYRDVVKACLTGDFGPEVDTEKDLDRAVLFNVVDPLSGCKA